MQSQQACHRIDNFAGCKLKCEAICAMAVGDMGHDPAGLILLNGTTATWMSSCVTVDCHSTTMY